MLRPRGVKCHFEVELGLIMGQKVRDMREGDSKWIDTIAGRLLMPCGAQYQLQLTGAQVTFSPST